MADKLVSLALRPNRIKNRDLWDIIWLKRQGINTPPTLIPKNIRDHKRTLAEFSALLCERTGRLNTDPALRLGFVKEMQRFLPVQTVRETVGKVSFWNYLSTLIQEETGQAQATVV